MLHNTKSRQNGTVPDTNGMLEGKEKKHGEERERRTGVPVKKWKDREQKKDG
jgi:hypothetical protein